VWVNNVQVISVIPKHGQILRWLSTTALHTGSEAYKAAFYSGYSTATMSDITFPPPSNLAYQKMSLTSIKFTWTDNSVGEDSFIIDKKVGANEWTVSYATTGANATEWTDNSAQVNSNIQYRIYGKAGSNYSNYAVSEVIDNTIPSPSNLTYNKLDINSIRLNWSDNSTGETGFVIDRSVNGTWTNSFATAGSNATQWTDDSAVINADLVYRIKAYYTTSYSNTVETGIISNTFPAPSNLTAQVTGMNITLNWTDNSTGETGFKIDRKYDGGLWEDNFATVASNIITWNETVADTGKYYYRVKAYSGTDLSATSAVAEAWKNGGDWVMNYMELLKDSEYFDEMVEEFGNYNYRVRSFYKDNFSEESNILNFSPQNTLITFNRFVSYEPGQVIQTSDNGYALIDDQTFKVAKYSETGSPVWEYIENRPDGFKGSSLIEVDDGYICIGNQGGMSTYAYATKLDVDGDFVWDKQILYSDYKTKYFIYYGWDVALNPNGNYVFLTLAADQTQSSYQPYIFEYDINGTKTYNDKLELGYEYKKIIKDYDGNLLILGRSAVLPKTDIMKMDSDYNSIWAKTYHSADGFDRINDVTFTNDGGYLFTGYTVSSVDETKSIYVVKLDNFGETVWNKTILTTEAVGDTAGIHIIELDNGDIIVNSRILYANALIKLDSNGNLKWKSMLGSGYAKSFKKTTDGGYIFYGTNFLLKTDGIGNFQGGK
jgi:hypothetical protein